MHAAAQRSGWSSQMIWPASASTSQRAFGAIAAISWPKAGSPNVSLSPHMKSVAGGRFLVGP